MHSVIVMHRALLKRDHRHRPIDAAHDQDDDDDDGDEDDGVCTAGKQLSCIVSLSCIEYFSKEITAAQ